MKRKRSFRVLSAILSLCMTVCCVSFAFASASAASVDSSSGVSAVAGSVVEDDGFTWDNATVYFLLTDRFRNGDTSNDHSYGRALDSDGNPIEGWDTAPGTFHGGDFAGITQTIEEGYFEALGVNALWISAPYEQVHGYVDSGSGFAHYSYHGYYVLDYTETDANFGTKEEFEELVDTAHEHGLRVIIDVVMNHSGYNTIADMEEFGFGTLLSGAEDYKYKLTDVSDLNDYIDYTSSLSDWSKWWGSDWIRSGLPGYTSDGGTDYTNSLSGLPDFKTEQTKSVSIPELLKTKWTQEGTYDAKLEEYGSSNTVTGYLTTWLSQWVRDYGVDGFRCDTAKHVEKESWNKLKTACVSALEEWRSNNPGKAGADWEEDFWMTGEHWDHGVSYDEYYTEGGFDSMINFSTCGASSLASSNVASVYQSYADSVNTQDGFNVLSFISSHDEVLARGDTSTMIYNGSALLLLPGGVQIFYGDESNRSLVSGLSFDGYGGSGHSLRSDMNWDSIDETVLAHWQKVGTFRNNHVSVGAGANISLSSSSGVAFGRTYNKNNVSDKIAGVIGCSSNTSVSVDVSSLWSDGQYLVNAYDGSSAVVSDGKVTFNSGANGTILIEEPDGQPLVSVTGGAEFYGTEELTVSLANCDSAKISVDGGNKFSVKDGDTFTIGSTAYKNDTVSVKVEAENEKTTTCATFTFVKLGEQDEEPVTDPDDTTQTTQAETVTQTSTLTVKSDYGTPYVYAWTGSSTAQLGAWPGTAATLVDGTENTYEITMSVPADTSFNVVLNDGSGTQSSDITGLYSGAVLEVTSSSYTVSIESSGIKEETGEEEPYEGSVTITVEPYSSSDSYYLYLWDDDKNEYVGAWPGVLLTEKNDNGNYVYTADGCNEINAIVNMGSGAGQTADITAVKDGTTIKITNSSCTTYELIEPEVVVSAYDSLKQSAREVLAMTSSDYTSSSWENVSRALSAAETLISAGEENTEEEDLNAALEVLENAKSSLVIAQPTLTYAVKGECSVRGTAAADAEITVTVDKTAYTTNSDDITGEFSVTVSELDSDSVITVDVERNGVSSQTYTYMMSNGDITDSSDTTQPSNESSILVGDVNLDGTVSIIDATEIQKYLANLVTFNETQLSAANTDEDDYISIKDATQIQKYLAKIIDSLP